MSAPDTPLAGGIVRTLAMKVTHEHEPGRDCADRVDNRLLCSEGSFDLPGLVELLQDKGFDGPWGVEILSTSFRALPAHDALKLAAESARPLLRGVE